jgi:hypothetical protein
MLPEKLPHQHGEYQNAVKWTSELNSVAHYVVFPYSVTVIENQ